MSANLSLIKIGTKLLARQRLQSLLSPRMAARCAGGYYWNHDWKPGPYPRTKEERELAAKRYGLLPEDYKPFPDDGNAPGDYPDLPAYSANHRDLFEHYEHAQMTRHFGEPVHLRAELYRQGFVDPNDSAYWRWRMPYWKQLAILLSVVLGTFGVLHLGDRYKYIAPVMAKQFPYDKKGKKHYLFEPADE